jgi:hypothetical protein
MLGFDFKLKAFLLLRNTAGLASGLGARQLAA